MMLCKGTVQFFLNNLSHGVQQFLRAFVIVAAIKHPKHRFILIAKLQDLQGRNAQSKTRCLVIVPLYPRGYTSDEKYNLQMKRAERHCSGVAAGKLNPKVGGLGLPGITVEQEQQQ